MGGMDGFGKVEPEANEPVFHAPWEGRVMAMMRAMGAAAPGIRHVPRCAGAATAGRLYLTASYYESWLPRAAETLVLSRGLCHGRRTGGGPCSAAGEAAAARLLRAKDVRPPCARGSYERPATRRPCSSPAITCGQENIHPKTHTRLPRYARGRLGVVERVLGCQVFPDSSALGNGRKSAMALCVGFEGRELWGDDADPTLKVSIDAFEPYLERV